MNEDGTPIVEDPGQTPPDPTIGEGGQEESQEQHLQPGQNPSDLDMEALLDQAEREEAEAKAAEEAAAKEEEEKANVEKGLNPDGTPKTPEEDPNKKTEEPPKPKTDEELQEQINSPVDVSNIESYYDAPEDPRYGIKPLPEVRDPEAGESAADYFKNVTLPAILQAQQNQVGFAQRNIDIETSKSDEATQARMETWENEIKNLAETKAIPALVFDKNGAVDPKSESGKIIGETWQKIAEYNEKNPTAPITSFDHGFRKLYVPEAEEKAKQAAAEAAQGKRTAANAVLNPSGNSAASPTKGPQHIRRGQSISDMDFDEILG